MNKDSIKKYLTRSSVKHIFWAVGLLVLAVLTFSEELWPGSVLFFLGSIYKFMRPSRIEKNVDALLKKYEDAGCMDDVVKDFENGIFTDNQKVRIGNRMIFSSQLHTIFDYDEIEKFYLDEEEVEGDDITTTYICLNLQLKNGKNEHLIRLTDSVNNREAINQACKKIKMMCPSARIEY